MATRTERIETRLTPAQKALISRAAELEGRTLSNFIMQSLKEAAERTIAERHVAPIRLNAEDSRAFAEVLLNPPKPNAALNRAFDAHDELIRE